MAMTTCPNCGKQLRPGARFCGNCGATLSPASPGKSAGDAAQPPADALPCPNCGQPVRRGARFCSHCGQTLDAEGASTTLTGRPPLPAAQPPAAGNAASSAETLVSGERRAAGARPAAPPAARPQRKGLPIVLLAALALVCLAVGAGGFLVARNQGWIGAPGATPTVAAAALPTEAAPAPSPQATSTTIPTAVIPETPEPLETQPVAPPTQAPPTLEPSPALPTATTAISTTLTGLPPTIGTTQPISGSLGALEVVLDDSFQGSLSENWLAWGDPRPTIDSGPGYKWLSLKADDSGAGGVTTRTGVMVTNAPGLEVEFDVALQERYPNASLYMDWDPQQTRRGPELREPGVFRLRVSKDTVTLQAPITRQTCDAPVDGFQQHRYQVRVIDGFGVELYLDGSATPACSLEFIGLATVPGRLSFSGRGWITHVRIAQPAVLP